MTAGLPAPGQGGVAALLLLYEGEGAVLLHRHPAADVGDLAPLVQLRAQEGQLILRGRLQRLDLVRHLRLEGHLRQQLVDGDERRDAGESQVAVLVVEYRPGGDDAPGAGAAGQAGALAGALAAVEEARRGDEG